MSAWLGFSIAAAFFESVKDSYSKISTTKVNSYTAAIALHLVSLIISIPLVLYFGIPTLTTPFWIGSAAFLFISPTWSLLYMKAIRIAPLSEVIPVMAFNPVTTALLSYFFADQALTLKDWAGVLAICLGMYLVYLQPELFFKDPLSPVKKLFSNRGAQAMMGVVVLWSFGAHFGKMRVVGSSAIFSTFASSLSAVVTTYFVSVIRRRKVHFKQFITHYKQLAPVGISYYLASVLSGFALVSGSAVYVFAAKRSSIVMSSFAGPILFKEKLSALKIAGTLIIMLGIALLAL